MALADEHAQHIAQGTPALSEDEASELLREVPDWSMKDGSICRRFQFKDFHEAMDFVNRVAEIVNREDHHPEIHISYNKVDLQFSTHSVKGLSRNDFILAAKVDQLSS